MNEDFVKAYNAEFKRNPDFFSVGGYDGMHVIYEALEEDRRQDRRRRADRGRQGHEMGKPARPDVDRSGDARHRAERLHPRGARRSTASCVNVEIATIKDVKDPK